MQEGTLEENFIVYFIIKLHPKIISAISCLILYLLSYKILKFLADWILLNTKLFSEGCRVSEYLGHCIFNNIKILKFLADWILLNTKLFSEGCRKSFTKILFYFQSNFLKNQVELKN